MGTLHRKVMDLRETVEQILYQFRLMDTISTNGPHVHLSCQEIRLVEFLGDKGSRIMRELAEFLLLAVNSVTSVVDNLEKKGIVQRQRSETDRRVVRVELTDAGRVVYKAVLDEKVQLFKTMLSSLTEEEQEIFMVLFRKIARAGWSVMRKKQKSSAG